MQETLSPYECAILRAIGIFSGGSLTAKSPSDLVAMNLAETAKHACTKVYNLKECPLTPRLKEEYGECFT
jgi:hypothetical protein